MRMPSGKQRLHSGRIAWDSRFEVAGGIL